MKCLEEELHEKETEEQEAALAARPAEGDHSREGQSDSAAGALQVSASGEILHPGATATPGMPSLAATALLPAWQCLQVRTGGDTAAVRFVNSVELMKLATAGNATSDWN